MLVNTDLNFLKGCRRDKSVSLPSIKSNWLIIISSNKKIEITIKSDSMIFDKFLFCFHRFKNSSNRISKGSD